MKGIVEKHKTNVLEPLKPSAKWTSTNVIPLRNAFLTCTTEGTCGTGLQRLLSVVSVFGKAVNHSLGTFSLPLFSVQTGSLVSVHGLKKRGSYRGSKATHLSNHSLGFSTERPLSYSYSSTSCQTNWYALTNHLLARGAGRDRKYAGTSRKKKQGNLSLGRTLRIGMSQDDLLVWFLFLFFYFFFSNSPLNIPV